MFMFPGWPGPVFRGNRSGIGDVGLPAMPALPSHPGGAGMAGASPFAGLAAHGVPITQSPSGRPMIRAGLGGTGGVMMPPEIPGMPKMPGPPDGLLGGPHSGGLFQPLSPVQPMDQQNLVRQLQEQERQQKQQEQQS